MRRCLLLLTVAAVAFPSSALALSPPRVGFNGGDVTMACSKAPVEKRDPDTRVKFIVRSQGVRRTFYGEMKSCWETTFSPSSIFNRRWSLASWGNFHSLYFQTNQKDRAVRARITAIHHNWKLLDVTFKQHYLRWPSRRIWEGSDAFFNYCLMGEGHIRSSGGHLYCDTPNKSFYYTSNVEFWSGHPFLW